MTWTPIHQYLSLVFFFAIPKVKEKYQCQINHPKVRKYNQCEIKYPKVKKWNQCEIYYPNKVLVIVDTTAASTLYIVFLLLV